MSTKAEFGSFGEQWAKRALKAKGWEILCERFRTRSGEIDLVARDAECLVFVEVKLRQSKEFGLPEEAVDEKKQRRMTVVAEEFLYKHPEFEGWDCRFDVVALEWPEGQDEPEMRHWEDAFRGR